MWWEGALFWAAIAMSVYGVISAVIHIIALIHSLQRRSPGIAYLVLVQNQADRVEGVVRALAREEASDLLLVDSGSDDDSPAILERLALEYEHARFLPMGTAEQAHLFSTALAATTAPFVVLVDLKHTWEKEGTESG